ncbi:Coiled-coil motif protein [Nitrosotalea devaniterrae]|uniref:Coiled-coil motif protein n=1 Tax=Nitrosotalea devaniterrae TaxID=1078905 RepID=A0A128A230_9ARCH|nr:Coiled-coil motif protein [Candidatus Nitrosotalea devanaterra]
MVDDILVRKIKEKIDKNENKLQKQIDDIKRIWEDTGLDPKDSSYLVEKTMRFEMAHAAINGAFLLFNETITEYKKLCAELEKSEDS